MKKFIKILTLITTLFFLCLPVQAAYNTYWATVTHGGTTGAMDDINGNLLADGDKCEVRTSTDVSTYHLNATSGASESLPNIIAPDSNPGTKRWLLTSSNSKYYVNAAAADQGANTDRSIKNLVDTIGGTKKATLVLTHTGVADETAYTLTTSETTTDNITVEFEDGAVIDGAGTLTAYSPENIKAGARQQITSGTLAFTVGGVVYPHWLGIDGTADEVQINACAVALEAATGNGVIQLEIGIYTVGAAIILGDYITLQGRGSELTVINRDFAVSVPVLAVSKYTGATVRQRSTSSGSPNTGIQVKNLQIKANDSGDEGNHLVLYFADWSVVENVKIGATYGDWSTCFVGDNGRITGLVIDNVSTGIYHDGLHIAGGSYWKVSDCDITSGDDAIAVGNSTNTAISDVTVTNCRVFSHSAFAIKIVQADGGGTEKIERITISNIVGHGGDIRNGMIWIDDDSGTNLVRNILLSNIKLTTGTTSTVNPYGVYVDYAQDVVFDKVEIITPVQDAWYIQNSNRITLNNCRSTAPQNSGDLAVRTNTIDDFKIDGCDFTGYGTHPIQLASVTDFKLLNSTIREIQDTGAGVRFMSGCARAIIKGNTFIDASGASSSYGMAYAAAAVTGVTFVNNDCNGVINGINTANMPADTYVNNNQGMSTETLTTSGGTMYPWGTTYLDSTGNNVNKTLGSAPYMGLQKTIVMTEASNATTITITNHETAEAETALFDAIDEYLLLIWTGTEWATVSNSCTFP